MLNPRNNAQVVGYLGRFDKDKDVHAARGGGCVVNCTVAVNEKYAEPGTKRSVEHCEWVRVALFGKLAEFARDNFSSGLHVLIAGRLRTESYTPQGSKQKREITKIRAGYVWLLGSDKHMQDEPEEES